MEGEEDTDLTSAVSIRKGDCVAEDGGCDSGVAPGELITLVVGRDVVVPGEAEIEN